jgi:hypothetical protein
MPWGSRRRLPLPKGWGAIRRRAFAYWGTRCLLAYPGCTVIATEVDHVGHPNDHSLANLRPVCKKCHATKTAKDANRIRRDQYPPKSRPSETHPGSIE